MTLGWKELLIIVLFLALGGAIWKAYHSGAVHAVQKQEVKAYSQAAQIKEKQDEIRNNRPDDAAFIKRLRQHTY